MKIYCPICSTILSGKGVRISCICNYVKVYNSPFETIEIYTKNGITVTITKSIIRYHVDVHHISGNIMTNFSMYFTEKPPYFQTFEDWENYSILD